MERDSKAVRSAGVANLLDAALVTEYASDGKRAYSELVRRVCTGLDDCGLVVIDGQPLCGKTELARQTLLAERDAGRSTYEFHFSNYTQLGTVRMIRRIAHAVARLRPLGNVSLLFDDVPSLDEAGSDALGHAVIRLVARSVRIVLVVSPECESVLDYLPKYQRIIGRSLLLTDMGLADWFPGEGDEALANVKVLTHCIPGLVAPLARGSSLASAQSRALPLLSADYCERASQMAGRVIGDLKVPDQRSLACAMLVLGSGDFDTLSAAGLRVDDETVFSLAVDYPLFGIDPYLKTFRVFAAPVECLDEALSLDPPFCNESLRPVVASLAARGDYARALHFAVRHLPLAQREDLAEGWPLEFANAGGLSFVLGEVQRYDERLREASPFAESPGMLVAHILHGVLTGMAEGALGALLDRLRDLVSTRMLERGQGEAHNAAEGSYRDMVLFEQARLLLLARAQWSHPDAVAWRMVAPEFAEPVGEEPDHGDVWSHVRRLELAGLLRVSERSGVPPSPSLDPLVVTLRTLVCVNALLLEGDFPDAFRIAIASGVRMDGSEVLSALLARSFSVASLFCGDTLDAAQKWGRRSSEELLEGERLAPIVERAAAIDDAQLAYLLARAPSNTEQLLSRASARSDQLVHVVLYLVLAINDARAGALRRAETRAAHAADRAGAMGARYLLRLSNLVTAITLALAGRHEEAREGVQGCLRATDPGTPDAVNTVALFFSEALSGDAQRVARMAYDLRESPCPPGLEPLLELMELALPAGVEREGSDGDASVLPERWQQGIVLWKARTQALKAETVAPESPQVPGERADAHDGRLRINVLGRFELVGGQSTVSDFGRRRKAGALVAVLASTRGHSIGRDRLLGILWPDARPDRARERYYSCMSYVRKVLGGPSKGKDALLQTTMGNVSLNSELVTCDVDLVWQGARRLTGRTVHGRQAVKECQRLIELYQGDLFVPSGERSPFFTERRKEVLRTYLDALVEGAEEALRSGLVREALWLARAAYLKGSARENVVESFVAALVLNREYVEAKAVYERYAQEAIDERDVLPSMRLRKLYVAVREGLGEQVDEARPNERGGTGVPVAAASAGLRAESWSIEATAEAGSE